MTVHFVTELTATADDSKDALPRHGKQSVYLSRTLEVSVLVTPFWTMQEESFATDRWDKDAAPAVDPVSANISVDILPRHGNVRIARALRAQSLTFLAGARQASMLYSLQALSQRRSLRDPP
jgi:hypothetical protein